MPVWGTSLRFWRSPFLSPPPAYCAVQLSFPSLPSFSHLHQGRPSLLLYRAIRTPSKKPPTLVDELIRSGALDKKLRYQRGHAIDNEYKDFKAAAKRAGQDSQAYNDKVKELKANQTPKPERDKQLAALAAAASKSAHT